MKIDFNLDKTHFKVTCDKCFKEFTDEWMLELKNLRENEEILSRNISVIVGWNINNIICV